MSFVVLSPDELDALIQNAVETAVTRLSQLNAMTAEPDFYTVQQAAQKTGIKISRLREGIHYGAIPVQKDGARVRLSKNTVQKISDYLKNLPSLKREYTKKVRK
jgi:excisionase family DNA binding protein